MKRINDSPVFPDQEIDSLLSDHCREAHDWFTDVRVLDFLLFHHEVTLVRNHLRTQLPRRGVGDMAQTTMKLITPGIHTSEAKYTWIVLALNLLLPIAAAVLAKYGITIDSATIIGAITANAVVAGAYATGRSKVKSAQVSSPGLEDRTT